MFKKTKKKRCVATEKIYIYERAVRAKLKKKKKKRVRKIIEKILHTISSKHHTSSAVTASSFVFLSNKTSIYNPFCTKSAYRETV